MVNFYIYAIEKNFPIWMGVQETVALVPNETVSRVLDRKAHGAITRRVSLPEKIEAPVVKGQELGEIFITINGVETRHPLVAASTIEKLPLHKRIGAFFKFLIFGAETSAPASE